MRVSRFIHLPILLVLLLSTLLTPAAALAGSPADSGSAAAAQSDASLMAAAPKGKWIDVNLSRQKLTAYVGTKAVKSTLVSTGVAGKRTPTGTFKIKDHVRSQLMTGPGYYLPNVPYVMHFYGRDALHGTYWHKNFGHTMSHGCINLPTSWAAWLYYWAPNGTKVVIHY